MLVINTVSEFFELSSQQRYDIQRSIQARARLDAWLEQADFRERENYERIKRGEVKSKPCKYCDGTGEHHVEVRESNDIHPSQLSKCIKLLWYYAMGLAHLAEVQTIEPRLKRIFDLGHAWHDMMQSYGERGAWRHPNEPSGLLSTYEREVAIDPDNESMPIACDFRLRGAADAVMVNYFVPNVPNVGDVLIRIVHEYKTMKSTVFDQLRRPKPEHLEQATTYSAALNAPLVVYFYLNKNTSDIADYVVPFDHGLWDQVARKLETVLNHRDAGVPPAWELTAAAQPGNRECYECPFRRHCNPPNRG